MPYSTPFQLKLPLPERKAIKSLWRSNMKMKWIDYSDTKYLKQELSVDGKVKVTIAKQRGSAGKWHGWVSSGGHKFGPFSGKADAKRWAEMAFPR